jgi:hypothetical protein
MKRDLMKRLTYSVGAVALLLLSATVGCSVHGDPPSSGMQSLVLVPSQAAPQSSRQADEPEKNVWITELGG